MRVVQECVMRIQIVVDDTYKEMLENLKRATGLNQWQDLFSDAITMVQTGLSSSARRAVSSPQ